MSVQRVRTANIPGHPGACPVAHLVEPQAMELLLIRDGPCGARALPVASCWQETAWGCSSTPFQWRPFLYCFSMGPWNTPFGWRIEGSQFQQFFRRVEVVCFLGLRVGNRKFGAREEPQDAPEEWPKAFVDRQILRSSNSTAHGF